MSPIYEVIPAVLILVCFIQPCISNSFFQVLNQPQEPSLQPGRMFTRTELYGGSQSNGFGPLNANSLVKRGRSKAHRKSRKHKKQGPPTLPTLSEADVAPFDLLNVPATGPGELNFQVLNVKPDSNELAPQGSVELTKQTDAAVRTKGRPEVASAPIETTEGQPFPLLQRVEDIEDGRVSAETPVKRAMQRKHNRRKQSYRGRGISPPVEPEAQADETEAEPAEGSVPEAAQGSAPEAAETSDPEAANPQVEEEVTAAPISDLVSTEAEAAAKPENSGPSSPAGVSEGKKPAYIDFVNSNDSDGANGTSRLGGGPGLNPNFTMEEYDLYCGVEELEKRKRICAWNYGISNDSYNPLEEREPPLDLNNLFEEDEPKNPEQVVAAQVHLIAAQNRKLMIETIKGAIWPYELEETEPANGFKLLNTTRKIFSKLCPANVVAAKFLQMVGIAFKRLHDITTPGRGAFISDYEFELIEGILEQCFQDSKPANYIQNDCKEDVVAINSTREVLCIGYILTEGVNKSTACFHTNYDVYDPILDISWLMFEAVKANCFNHFQGNIRLFHRYSVAIKDLFSRPLKARWPLQRESREYWERLLGPSFYLGLNNIDKCVHHIIDKSEFDFRTPRFLNINSVRLSHTKVQFL